MTTSYISWSCNHCPACHFVGGISAADQASAVSTAKAHNQASGHSMTAKKVVEGQTVESQWGVAAALEQGWILPGGVIVKDTPA